MASFLYKDKSWVNKIIFPAPVPQYDADSFDQEPEGTLMWIPRKRAATRRPHGSPYEPESVPCLFYPCNIPGSNKILLWCHGNAEDLGFGQRKLRLIRDRLNIHVLGIEYPGYGISNGTPSESALKNDLLVVYTFLTEVMGWPPRDIILFGYSIGTGPTSSLAARKPTVGGLVLLAPYTSIRDMVNELLPKGVGKVAGYLISNRFINTEEIRSVHCPTLIIHGKNDSMVPYTHSQTLFKFCQAERKQLYLVEGMEHGYSEEEFACFVLMPMRDFLDLDDSRTKGPSKPLRNWSFPSYVFEKPPKKEQQEEKKERLSNSEPESPLEITDSSPLVTPSVPILHGPDPPPSSRPCTPVDVLTPVKRDSVVSKHKRDSELSGGYSSSKRPLSENKEDLPEDNKVDLDEIEGKMEKMEYKEDEVWACHRCTFENQMDLLKCEMCEGPRTGTPDISNDSKQDPNVSLADILRQGGNNQEIVEIDDRHSGSEPEGQMQRSGSSMSTWACNRCTLVNQSNTDACEVCDAPRQM